ncbi:unnamed protein product [Cuscuta epithymum]|uniref:Uncharacterized protein n=1 Tax=Cuscuta epithymum TaxID=186058 RepID=A0AAV0DA80_9ASTE|nr:unnamed protein product [Cuscuta epithymum]
MGWLPSERLQASSSCPVPASASSSRFNPAADEPSYVDGFPVLQSMADEAPSPCEWDSRSRPQAQQTSDERRAPKRPAAPATGSGERISAAESFQLTCAATSFPSNFPRKDLGHKKHQRWLQTANLRA